MTKLVRPAAVLMMFALAAAGQSPAQNWNSAKALVTGTEVRVKLNSRTVRGQIQSVTDDAIAVNSGKGQEMLMRQDVVQVSMKVKGHRGRNTLIGLAAGAGLGAIIGAVSHKSNDCCFLYTTRAQDAAIGAIILGVVGTAVGAVIPTGGWHEVYKR